MVRNTVHRSSGSNRRQRSLQSNNHIAKKRDRLIFRYWNGEREVVADPLEIQATLSSIPDFDLETDAKMIEVTSPEFQGEAQQALNRLVNAIRIAFSVKPFEQIGKKQTGLTRGECVTLFMQFVLFLEDLKKKLGILPTMPSATAGPAEPSPMPNMSGCSPTVDASLPVVPLPSPSVPLSPLVASPLGSGSTP